MAGRARAQKSRKLNESSLEEKGDEGGADEEQQKTSRSLD